MAFGGKKAEEGKRSGVITLRAKLAGEGSKCLRANQAYYLGRDPVSGNLVYAFEKAGPEDVATPVVILICERITGTEIGSLELTPSNGSGAFGRKKDASPDDVDKYSAPTGWTLKTNGEEAELYRAEVD